MKLETRDALLGLAVKHDIAAEGYDGYSGRGMFGERTAALTVEHRDDIGILCGMYESQIGKLLRPRVDNLGHDYIAY